MRRFGAIRENRNRSKSEEYRVCNETGILRKIHGVPAFLFAQISECRRYAFRDERSDLILAFPASILHPSVQHHSSICGIDAAGADDVLSFFMEKGKIGSRFVEVEVAGDPEESLNVQIVF